MSSRKLLIIRSIKWLSAHCTNFTTIKHCIWEYLFENNDNFANQKLLLVYIHQPLRPSRMWHGFIFKAELNWFGFKVFLLLDWLPNPSLRTKSALLFNHSWRDNKRIHTFPKGISALWNAVSSRIWTRRRHVHFLRKLPLHHGHFLLKLLASSFFGHCPSYIFGIVSVFTWRQYSWDRYQSKYFPYNYG